ncbi:MAG TPA: formate/nitrite transporter family protein [Candidatus Sulfotelmatobacter sp.]|nr:formate/nitrite transporter family protein [Candidatus Sulfotelmatobacter sp.]
MNEKAKSLPAVDEPAPELATIEQRQQQRKEEAVEQRKAISAQIVYGAILAEGEAELERPTSALAFSGLAAGLSMGFSFLTEGFLAARLPESHWAPLVSKFGYAMGFLIVILGRQQLFTENTLTPILPLLKHKRLRTLWNTLRLWGTVLLANWVGTIALGWVLAHTGIIEEAARPTFLRIGLEAMGHDFATTLIKAIFAGWLIALLVWVLPFAETGRVAVIILMTYVISLGAFSHVIAGSVDTFYLVALGEKTWGQYLGNFMLPTLLGNIIGGVSLVAALNHAQVVAGTTD